MAEVIRCPACSRSLPATPASKCPRCGHVLSAVRGDQVTAAHTPTAKRRDLPRGRVVLAFGAAIVVVALGVAVFALAR